MKISKEQLEAIEYLEKYTKCETYGERNLEKDIITVLELLRDLYNDNIRYEKALSEKMIRESVDLGFMTNEEIAKRATNEFKKSIDKLYGQI